MNNEESVKSILITGDDLQFVLFKTAINSAKCGFRVWYISILPFEKIPADIEIPEKEVLNLITFIYLKDYQCLISHLNGIHLWRNTPKIILIDRFDLYSNINDENYDPIRGALIATSILDASSSVSRKSNENIFLVITCKVNGTVEKRLNLLKQLYFPKMFMHSTNSETITIIDSFIV